MAMSVYRVGVDVPPPTRTVQLVTSVPERDVCLLASTASPIRSVQAAIRATGVRKGSVSAPPTWTATPTTTVWRRCASWTRTR